MKTLTLIFTSVLLMEIEGYLIKVPTTPTNSRIAPVGWVHVQKLLLPLFENVCEVSTDSNIVRLNEEFELDPTIGNYLKPDVINNLLNLKATKGLLAKGEIFTELNSDHFNELKIMFEVLYYARDFDTFYKAACWARQNLNCGLFVDVIYLTVLTRRDTEKVSLPPPYEVLPNYFIGKDIIIKASSLIRGEDISSDNVRNEGNAYILDVNHTTNIYDNSDDKLAYFHEDVGLNSYYFFTKLKNVQWCNDIRNQNQNNNGEDIYHTMKQLMARYNLERYSNGLPELEGLGWDNIYDLPYDPMLVYSNGNSFTQRISINNNVEIITLLKNIESNLPAVVIHMRDNGYNKSEILNHIMEILVTNEKSYENLAIQILSVNCSGSSVLEHYLTSIRDPIFWRLNKKIIDMVDNALSILPSYTRNQLYFPGVQIENVDVKKMMTSFDNYEFDVTDALKTENKTKFQVKIAQSRLNHKPFGFKINITSLTAQKALVKMYIGPKVMPGEFDKKKNLFILLDCFEANLKIGNNLLSRNSNEMTNLSQDLVSIGVVRKNILDTEFGIDAVILKSVWSQIRFPSRLILPRGTSSGLPFQVFVFVAPYIKATFGGSRNNTEVNLEALISPGYPLDLNTEIQELFNLPNAFIKDIIVTHKTESTSAYNKPINTFNEGFNDRLWPRDEVDFRNPKDLLSLADLPGFSKKKFDYQSKKNQFGNRAYYSHKRIDNNNELKNPEQNDKTVDFYPVEVEGQREKTEIINNIYITPHIDSEVEKDINRNGNKFMLDEDSMNKVLHNEINEDVNKVVNVNNHKETEDKKILNNVILDNDDDVYNILHKNENEEVNTKFDTVQEDVENTNILDEDNENNILYNELNEQVNNLEKTKETNKVNPHGLLTMPGKRFTNIFKIVFASQKPDSYKKVYI